MHPEKDQRHGEKSLSYLERFETGDMVMGVVDDAIRSYRRLMDDRSVRAILALAASVAEMEKPEYQKCANDLGSLRFLTVQQFEYFYQFYKEGGETVGWQEIERVFSEPEALNVISDTLSSCEFVDGRAAVIQQGLDAHRNGNYIAAVSILLPQGEGVVWEIGVAKGLVEAVPNSMKKKDGTGDWKFLRLVEEIWSDVSPVDKFPVKIKEEFYSRNLRHPCLHGRDTNCFNKQTSTKVVLMMWGVLEEYRNVKSQKSAG